MITEVDYPTPDEEDQILQKAVPLLSKGLRTKMIAVAHEIRKLHTGDEDTPPQIDTSCSTRALIRWAKLLLFYKNTNAPAIYSMHRAFGFGAEPSVRIMLEEVIQRVFGSVVPSGN